MATMRDPLAEKTGMRTVAPPALIGTMRVGRPGVRVALYRRPPCSVHVTKASDLPSGAHAGSASMASSVLTRRGVPLGQSIT